MGSQGGDRPRAVDLGTRLALTLPEAAAALGVSERHLRSLRGELPTIHLGERCLLPVDLLRDWMRQRVEQGDARLDAIVEETLDGLGLGTTRGKREK